MGTKEAYNWFNDPRNFMSTYDFGPNLRGGAQFAKESMDYMAGMASGMSRRPFRSRARYAFKGSRSTKSRQKSVARQKTITAPMSRRIDTKYTDFTNSVSGLKSSAPQSYVLSNIAQGSGEGQRIGNDVRLLKFIISLDIIQGSTLTDQTFRMLLFYDKTGNSNASVPQTNVFNADVNGYITPSSLRNVTNLEDYVILLDKMFRIDMNFNAAHGQRIFNFEVKTSIGQRYSGAAGTTVVKNPVHVMLLTNALNATTGASGQLLVRTIYSDVC